MKTIIDMGLRGKEENFESISESVVINKESFGSFSKGVSAKGFLGLGSGGKMENSLVYRGRSSMIDKKIHVAEAGYLTRKLVEFLYPLRVIEDDCGTLAGLEIIPDFLAELCSSDKYNLSRLLYGRYVRENLDGAGWKIFDQSPEEAKDKLVLRSPVTCRTEDGLCSKCLGLNLSTGLPFSPGDFAGVLAGHTIGERGTQLSMKTFQTGKKDFNMQRVSSVIFEIGNGKGQDYLQYLLELSQIDLTLLMGKSALFRSESPEEQFFKALDLASVYFEILFTMMNRANVRSESEAMKLTRSLEARGFFSALSFETSKRQLNDLRATEDLEGIYPEKSPKALYALTIDRMR
jgi:DNA-directed RNA polymerase subunit beta